MDRDSIIDGLRMTMDLCVFDPSTGEEIEPHLLNDISRATYDACKGALEILERLDTDSDTISRQAAIEAVMECYDNDELFEVYEEKLRELPPSQPEQLGANLAEVGTDCISRQALLDKFEPWLKVKDYNDGELNMLKAVLYEIRFMPPAQPKSGKWIDAVIPNDNGGLLVQVCDQCNTFFPLAYTGGGHHFCPNCGADMKEVTE